MVDGGGVSRTSLSTPSLPLSAMGHVRGCHWLRVIASGRDCAAIASSTPATVLGPCIRL